MSSRVIAGTAKGKRLQMPPGDSTRPITDRAKEALFSIIHDWLPDARFLDLFGGTGAVGIEALSRGSAVAYFVERDRRAFATIQANLTNTRLADRARVEQGDSFAFLQRYRGEPFDFIFIAPPQYQGLWHKALQFVDTHPQLLSPTGSVIVQIHPREDEPVALGFLEEYDRRRYGSVLLLFYASAEALAEEEDGGEEDRGEEDRGEEDEEPDDDDDDNDAA